MSTAGQKVMVGERRSENEWSIEREVTERMQSGERDESAARGC